ncbi:MAG: Daunorubicin/doxorubicin resistance ATP-binding protein DrrA [Streptosporangiaceae bacterium]|nr:Daunorubicin/doxorubicin resistance ATP-binding protein DrrA [Streptosporangiaceae bacterium]
MTTTTSPSALRVTGLRKSFGEKTVLEGIDLDIGEGTTFALLGPNGGDAGLDQHRKLGIVAAGDPGTPARWVPSRKVEW